MHDSAKNAMAGLIMVTYHSIGPDVSMDLYG